MRQSNIFSPLWRSFYSKDLYRDVFHNWGGSIFAYLLLLIALCNIPWLVSDSKKFNEAYQQSLKPILVQLPTVIIKNGVASIDKPSPYFIKDPKTQEVIGVFDTNTNHPKEYNRIPTLIFWVSSHNIHLAKDVTTKPSTRKEIINKASSPTEQSVAFAKQSSDDTPFSKNTNFVFHPNIVISILDKLLFIAPVAFFIIMVLGSFIYRLLQGLVYALVAMIVAAFNNVSITYSQAYRLSIIAVTPSIIIGTLGHFIFKHEPHLLITTAYFLITLAYLIFGVRANRSE